MDRPLLQLGLPAPQLPDRAASGWRSLAASLGFHTAAAVALAMLTIGGSGSAPGASPSPTSVPTQMPRMVFLQAPGPGGGGGGGGNRQPSPPSRAQGIGRDQLTLPVARPVTVSSQPIDTPPTTPSIVLHAVPLAAGTSYQMGMPEASSSLPFSPGPGSGGGVGEGEGTGIGPGRGPGYGPGAGGGFGGGLHRPGNGVVAPRLVKQVQPVYTPEAMARRVQGTVVLEAVIGLDGVPTKISVVRSLDQGLDMEAIRATRQWRFVPGHLNGTPVHVLVNIALDFRIH